MTNSPQRIQRKRTKGWRMPEGAVYVGRPTRWGNPFVVGDQEWHVSDRRTATDNFRDLMLNPDRWVISPPSLVELAGRDLACWCPIGQPCHADVLLELANGDLQ